jgi:hypothetical protein
MKININKKHRWIIKNCNKKLTAYNIFIKDSFNAIYSRKCLNILPIYIKSNISIYKNKKACIVIIELAKLWIDPKNSEIVYKYKLYNNQISFFTNNTYNSIALYISNKKKDRKYKNLINKIKIFDVLQYSFISIKNKLLKIK